MKRKEETVASSVAELRSLAEFCNFGDTLDVMLRDRIVCGINDSGTQKRLLAESTLTYARALEIAKGQETAAQNLETIQAREEDPRKPVNKVHAKGKGHGPAGHGTGTLGDCSRCGRPGHLPAQCKFREAKCHQCGKTGHLKKVCHSRQKGKGPKNKPPQRPVCRLEEEEEESEDEPVTLHQIGSKGSSLPPLQAQVQLDDCQISMEIDTGAAVSLMSEKSFRHLWPRRSLTTTEVRVCSYSKEPIPVKGSTQVKVAYQGQTAQLPLLIVEGSGPLMGRDWLQKIKLDWGSIHHVSSSGLQELLSKHPSVFQDGLGTLQGFEAHIEVEPGAQPRFCRARTVPYALRELVEADLQRLVAEGT